MTSEIISIPRTAIPKLLNKLYHLYYETNTEWFDIRLENYNNSDYELRVNTDLVHYGSKFETKNN